MSDAVSRPLRGLGTARERIKLGERIINTWPQTKGHGPKAEERLRKLTRAIIKSFQLALSSDIFWVIDNYWSVRCEPSWDMTFLEKLVQEEFDKAIEEGRRPPLSSMEKYRRREQQRREKWEKRQANAKLTQKLADALSCTLRYASMLRKDGTTNRAVAQQMADVLGTAVKDHLRAKSKTGRQVDFSSWFLRLWVPGGSFRDFLQDVNVVLPANAESLAATLREQQGDPYIQLAEIESLEKLIQLCISFEITNKSPAVAMDIWTEFKLWKIELVAALATRMVKEKIRTESLHPQHHRRADTG